MRGHDKLIELRKRGRKPSMVFINDYVTRGDFLDGSTVDISDESDMRLVDLRFLVGLRVSAAANNVERAMSIMDALKRAKVGQAIVCVVQEDYREWSKNEYFEVWNG